MLLPSPSLSVCRRGGGSACPPGLSQGSTKFWVVDREAEGLNIQGCPWGQPLTMTDGQLGVDELGQLPAWALNCSPATTRRRFFPPNPPADLGEGPSGGFP